MDRPDGLSEDELLAHLRGKSTPEQAARIEAAAAQDATLRAELALMGGLKDALAESTDGPDMREFGWRRLESEIAKSTQPQQPNRMHLWRIAVVFLGAIVLGQGAYIALAPSTGDAPVFRTVSEEAPSFSVGVVFAPEASAQEIETLLREVGARVVDGPSAIGLYRLEFETEDARGVGLVALGASPLVELVAEE